MQLEVTRRRASHSWLFWPNCTAHAHTLLFHGFQSKLWHRHYIQRSETDFPKEQQVGDQTTFSRRDLELRRGDLERLEYTVHQVSRHAITLVPNLSEIEQSNPRVSCSDLKIYNWGGADPHPGFHGRWISITTRNPRTYTVAQKLAPFICSLYQILTDFQNHFTVKIRRKSVIILSLKIPPHLKCVATLPCEMCQVS